MPRPLIATIHIAAMRHNLAVAKSLHPHTKLWAVIKANAYGHGLENGMRGFEAADGLALIELESAVQLRAWGWKKPILLLEGFFEPADLSTVIQQRLEVCIHCDEQIAMLEHAQQQAQLSSSPFNLDVHLKMNTGMNRLGFMPTAYAAAYRRLRAISGVRNITFMTHFANADALQALQELQDVRLPVAEQWRRFQSGIADIEDGDQQEQHEQNERCVANSAIHMLHPEIKSDWARPGIMLYGGMPNQQTAQEFDLRPAMTLRSEIVAIQSIKAGESIGYGSSYTAQQEMTIGVIACGYADGYPRHAPNGTPILVDGIKTQIVGRVSMDMITVDLTAIPHARVGSPVTLWGAGLPIDEVASAAGTIGYELMCALAPRVTRVVTE